ncbi:hypothetical protein BDU57DRAFT_17876 [Ampelomyces quisqualis]|uniref:Uncharacterized protein n=1 Tax=Ampelomyces quisqualis TaxID=50730 RepID=A0A6A5R182_AMPQU|nr:hypothetical protein BDU57DRAFT_17876 [Ampelomyces quisqualis]
MPYPFAAVDATGLPIAVEVDDTPDRIRLDIFNRLHWNVFGPQSDITVQDGEALTPFIDHAIGSESIAEPPVFRITVRIQICEDKSSIDQTDEEKYRYQPPDPLVIENRDGAPILLKEFINQVHPFLSANKNEIYRCEDENYWKPTELEDGIKFDGVDPAEFDGADENENQSTEPSLFIRSGNIQTGSTVFFDQAQFNEADTDDFEVYIGLFVEGNMGISSDQFWRHRARA